MTPLATDPAMRPTVRMGRQRESITRLVVGIVMGSGAVSAGVLLWSLWTRNAAEIANLGESTPPPVNYAPQSATLPAISVPPITSPPVTLSQHDSTPVEAAAPAAHKQQPTSTRRRPEPEKQPVVVDSAAPAPTVVQPEPDRDAIVAPLKSLAMAMGNGEVAIRGVFPQMPQSLLESLRSEFYSKVDNISTAPEFGTPTITGDKGEVDFTLRLSYMLRDSKAKGATTLKYRATLARHGEGWEITDLRVAP